MMHTKDRLAQALQKIDPAMAEAAAAGYYDDFLSPLATPIYQLVTDLRKVGTPEALVLAGRAIDGEFDATKEESAAWAASPEGVETFGKLLRPGKKFRP